MLGISKNAMDTLLVNLKVLSKIECGDRLMTSKKHLELDKTKGWVSTILRWFKEESREKTIKEIHNNLENAFTCIINITSKNSPEIDSREFHNLSILLTELESANIGLKKLKKTYSQDATIEAKLDVEIQQIIKYVNDGKSILQDQNPCYILDDDCSVYSEDKNI